MGLIKKIINIKPGEGKMVLTFFFFSFFTIAMGLTAKTAKDAYFLSRFDKSILPLMFLAVAIAIAPILSGYTKIAKKLAPKVMFILTLVFVLILLLIASMFAGIFIEILNEFRFIDSPMNA